MHTRREDHCIGGYITGLTVYPVSISNVTREGEPAVSWRASQIYLWLPTFIYAHFIKAKELDGGIQPPTQLDKVGIYALILEVMTPRCKGLRLGTANPIPIFYFIPFFLSSFFE